MLTRMIEMALRRTTWRAVALPRIALVLVAVPFAGSCPARGEGPAVTSEVKTLAIAAAREIPKAPPKSADESTCSHLTAKPKGTPGRLVASRGWAVTGEVGLAEGIEAVSFVGTFEQGTSGSCRLTNGNVAVFQGEALLAIAYAPRGAQDGIGSVLPLEGGGARIWSGDFLSQPIADLRVGRDGALSLVPVAPQETFCVGKAVVPNVYGMPIDRARKLFLSSAWTPVPGKIGSDRTEQGREIDLVKGGVVEVENCSGTGFGYCSYIYRGPAGTLSVTTVGDGDYPSVAGYDVTCR